MNLYQMDFKTKPTKELRTKYQTDYPDKTVFASNARLLQSIWRTEQGYECEKLGNFLKIEFAKSEGSNFLSKSIFDLVKKEVADKSIAGRVISEPRIWNNLLSSQPLAFNLFGELKYDLNLTQKVFSNIYPELKIREVIRVELEYSPGRRSIQYTNDASAFDVFIEYLDEQLAKCFFGIEVKYAEHLKDRPSSHKHRYEEVASESEVFDMSKLDMLKESPIQQIWRDHLLALSMFKCNQNYKRGDFIYLYPESNYECNEALIKYKNTFLAKNESYLLKLTLESLTKSIMRYSNADWIRNFQDRYLNFDKIDEVQG